MLGGLEQHLGLGDLNDLARIHDRDVVTGLGNHAHVVGHQDHGHPRPLLQIHKEREDLILDRHVEGRRRLIRQNELGLGSHRHGDHRTLEHAARPLERVFVVALLRARYADAPQELDPGPPRCCAPEDARGLACPP